MEPKQLKGKVINGVIWNVIELIINKFFAFAIKLILAKLLFPDQFGIVGMATVFTSFMQVFNDLGIGAALVQRKEENLREEHFHTAFWTGIVWSITIYLIISFIVAPLAADFYNTPILRDIIPVLSIGVLSSPINLVHRAQLTKQMNFKSLAFISNVSTVVAGVIALVLAFMGAGVWSLVFNSVVSFIVAMPLFFWATKWTPKLIWEKQAFKDVFGFGVYTTGTSIFGNLILNLDYLLIGKLLSAAALGKYTLAFVLTDSFRSQLMTMMNKVMYPVYGQKQDDLPSLKRYYLKVVKYNSLTVYPVMIFLIVYGEPFIINFFGDKWIDTVQPLKILALSVMIHMLVSSHTSLIRGLGQPKLEMRIQLFKAIVLYIPLIYFGIHFYGIVGAAWACVIYKVLEVIVAQYFLKKIVNVAFFELIISVKASLMASVISLVISYVSYDLGLHYIAGTILLFTTYAGIVWLMMKTELTIQINELKNSKTKKAVTI